MQKISKSKTAFGGFIWILAEKQSSKMCMTVLLKQTGLMPLTVIGTNGIACVREEK